MRTKEKDTQAGIFVWRIDEEGKRKEKSMTTLNKFCNLNFTTLFDAKIPGYYIRNLREEIEFERSFMSQILGIKRTAYFNVLKRKSLDVSQVDVLSNFAKVYRQGLEAFENDADDLEMFLNRENQNLGNIKPKELLFTESGRRALSKAFDRIKYGSYG